MNKSCLQNKSTLFRIQIADSNTKREKEKKVLALVLKKSFNAFLYVKEVILSLFSLLSAFSFILLKLSRLKYILIRQKEEIT